MIRIRFPNPDGKPLAGCEAGTIIYVFTPGEVTVCPYLVFAARTPQSQHDLVEHSWVGRTGDGYRYDQAHCNPDLAANWSPATYLHQPRLDRLSDHSALSARLAVDPGKKLLTSDPAAASEPPTLF